MRAERDENLPFRVDGSKADLKRTDVDCSALSINAPPGIRDAPPGQGVPLGPTRSPHPSSFAHSDGGNSEERPQRTLV